MDKKKVVIVEDNALTLELWTRILKDLDCQVLAFKGGQEAIDGLTDRGVWRPDLIITDLHMPGKNGFDVCRFVKANLPNTMIVVSVASETVFERREAAEIGVEMMPKFIRANDFKNILERVAA